jgi:asparagine synthase (glutamine-hydrolysing)
MCGICGTVALAGLRDPDAAQRRVEAMLLALSHRGPDAAGHLATPDAVLGATRLAIRGLADGNQPMLESATGVVVVCNGEIDNHRELRQWLAAHGRPVRQATDVAVIPGLYAELGDEFASRLVGAFAVAVWDPRSRRLTLARDRAGERPLFFARGAEEIIFATEVAAIVSKGRLPVTLDQEALRKFLQLGSFPSPETPFAEIQKVAPGELVQISAKGIQRRRYWRWPILETTKQPPSLDAFDQTFRGAVARQSDVDVDFGVFLSGGIDSSLVSAVARSLHPKRPLKAFTLRFEEDSYDEGSFAEIVARQLEMEMVTVWVRPEDVRTELATLVRLVGEPLADPAWLPAALLAKRAAQDIRLALVGEGADELFGGYPTHLGAGLAERFARLPGWLKAAIRRVVEALPPSEKKVTISFLLKRFVQGADLDGLARHRLWVSNLAPALLRRLGVQPMDLDGGESTAGELLDRVQRWDLETSLAEGLLTKADRASMSSALELRAPFLDEAVMAFAATLPVSERVRGFETKSFLKRYALRYLPKTIVHRRKRGLSVPIGRWLRGPLHEWAKASLASGRLARVGISTAAASGLFEEHCRREADHARALWALLVLSEWLAWAQEQTEGGSPKSEVRGPK